MNASDCARDSAFDVPEVRRVQPRVDAAADKLLARGVQPTVSLIRGEIGGGSPNAVAPALRYWRERRDRALGRTSATDAIPSPVLAAARTLYEAALDSVGRAAGSTQVELASQLEIERAKNATLALELKHAQRELETLRAERASVFEAAGDTHGKLVNAQALAAHCIGQQKALQRRLDESQRALGEARARIVALEATCEIAAKPRNAPPNSKRAPDKRTIAARSAASRRKPPARRPGARRRASSPRR